MLRNVFTKTLWDQRRGILLWSAAIAAVGTVYAAFYPSMNNPNMAAALEAYPEGLLEALGMTDITSPAGYVGSTTYGLLGPVLAIIFGSSLGARAIAGEEEEGRLDVLLAHPASRTSVVLQRAAAVVVPLALAGVFVFGAMLAVSGAAGLDAIGAGNFAAASLQLTLLGTVFGMLALAVGAVTGRRAIALGVVSVVAIGTYLANTLGPTVDALAWTQHLSPFRYYSGGQPLVNGVQWDDAIVLAASAAVLAAVAAVGLNRRDVAV